MILYSRHRRPCLRCSCVRCLTCLLLIDDQVVVCVMCLFVEWIVGSKEEVKRSCVTYRRALKAAAVTVYMELQMFHERQLRHHGDVTRLSDAISHARVARDIEWQPKGLGA